MGWETYECVGFLSPVSISDDLKVAETTITYTRGIIDWDIYDKREITSEPFKFKCSLEVKSYQDLLDKWKHALGVSVEAILKKCTTSFIYAAYKFTPPRQAIGRINIPKNFYIRHVELLKDVIESGNSTSYDRSAYKKNMKYKIFTRSEASIKKGTSAYAYAKTAAEAKSLSKIANRGLARWSWGSDADSGVRPKSLDRLAQRAPNLRRHNFNKIVYQIKNSSEGSVYITNYSKHADAYLRFASIKGLDNANRTMKKCKHATIESLEILKEQMIYKATNIVTSSITKIMYDKI